jgi:hypothetical protein
MNSATTETLHVFYSQRTIDTAMYGMVKDAPVRDRMRVKCLVACAEPSNYRHVASIPQGRDLEDAWEMMQSECSELPRTLRVRSMMVGDIVVNPSTREAFIVDACGFERFDLADVDALLAAVTS